MLYRAAQCQRVSMRSPRTRVRGHQRRSSWIVSTGLVLSLAGVVLLVINNGWYPGGRSYVYVAPSNDPCPSPGCPYGRFLANEPSDVLNALGAMASGAGTLLTGAAAFTLARRPRGSDGGSPDTTDAQRAED
ncbi:hypothetical protein GCM10011579_060210 [Streptomyces albiflavescens]|uniref:Uncharacterized protein n=1 Tax=Streptomyces albiflavescens TaxID=1623582 RepID=A0A917Y866_9ACTN|nr:hypothetical protein GCM10011579_060210 [Streptomyces albiflavescens]